MFVVDNDEDGLKTEIYKMGTFWKDYLTFIKTSPDEAKPLYNISV